MIIKVEEQIASDILFGDIREVILNLSTLIGARQEAINLRLDHSMFNGYLLTYEREETNEEIKIRETLEANKIAISEEADRVMKVRKAKKRIQALGC